jgi:hypothetical protein
MTSGGQAVARTAARRGRAVALAGAAAAALACAIAWAVAAWAIRHS